MPDEFVHARSSDLPIAIRDVAVRAGATNLLSAVSLVIAPGLPTVFIGPNGAGKTTLIRVSAGLTSPTAGQITWGGRSTTDGRRLAIVFQRPVMLRRSAAANVAFALRSGVARDQDRAIRTQALLELVGLGDLGARPARRLSGGEQQRLALARALGRDPEILFLDEPTANLDPAATKAVEDIVAKVAAAGVKVVLATHDLGQARRMAGEVVLLIAGRVCEVASGATFFTAPATPEAHAFLRGDLVV